MKTTYHAHGLVSGPTMLRTGLRMLILLVFCFFTWVATAQTDPPSGATTYPVKGTVLAARDNTPLAGVNIYLKGTTVGTFSDSEGKFTFPRGVAAGEVLIFSFVGLVKQELVVTAALPAAVEIRMEEDTVNVLGEIWIDTSAPNKSKRRHAGN